MRKTSVIVNCSNCGTELERQLCLVKSQENHYCNRKCRAEWCKKNWTGKDSPAYRGGPVQMNCAWCDKGLEVAVNRTKSHKEHFCNKDCKKQWWRSDKNPLRNRIEVNCTQCGKTLSKTPAQLKQYPKHFCDRKCFSDWRRENWQDGKAPQWKGQPGMVEVTCEACGKAIRRYPDRIENQEKQFCNRKCYAVWQSQNQSGENHHMWNGGKVKVNCAECGEELERIRYEVESRSEKFFCNLECGGKWRSKNIVGANHPRYQGNYLKTECAQCSEPLEIENWRRGRGNRNFCNYKCMGQWVSENATGETRYNWKGGRLPYYGPNWRSQREAARKRDNHQCQYCEMTEEEHLEVFGQVAHVHHIKPFREFDYKAGENENYKEANSLENLITLCAVCHKRMEAGKIQLVVDHN